MKLYMLKYNMLYYICNCNLNIPLNDFDAYDHYINHRFLYNKNAFTS